MDYSIIKPGDDTMSAAASLMLFANELIGKAIERRCSDMYVEPDSSNVFVRYLMNQETITEVKLPVSVLSELVFCYKVIGGLDLKESNLPQDKKLPIKIGDANVEVRITTIPGEYGETVAVSFRYL